jgi:hypothetical protein
MKGTYRTHLEEHSERYIGTNVRLIPTHQPAKTRPAKKRGRAVAAVCMQIPTEKMITPMTMDHRRPKKSAAGPENRAPKKAPMGKVETTRDCSDEVMPHVPVEGSYFPKVHSQSSMVWTPAIVPVS